MGLIWATGRQDLTPIMCDPNNDPGKFVKKGEPIGRVGNSGNTAEPHLHIHAIRSEKGSIVPVPLLFDQKLLSMNSVYVN